MALVHNYFFLSCCVFLGSCGNRGTDSFKLDTIDWIIGQWENITDSTQFYEHWRNNDNSGYTGEAYVISAGDTVFREKISIEKKNYDIYYFATVPDQNESKTIPFRLISCSENELVFENREHDFPNKIIYTKITTDSLVARIEGERDGKTHAEYFPFRRKKPF